MLTYHTPRVLASYICKMKEIAILHTFIYITIYYLFLIGTDFLGVGGFDSLHHRKSKCCACCLPLHSKRHLHPRETSSDGTNINDERVFPDILIQMHVCQYAKYLLFLYLYLK